MGTETNVTITIKNVTMEEYTKLVASIKDTEKTKAVYDCDNHSVEMQTRVKTIYPALHLGAFERGFNKKLDKVLGRHKVIEVA